MSTQASTASTGWVQFDTITDYVPILGNVENLTYLIIKHVGCCCSPDRTTLAGRLFSHIKAKDSWRCAILLVPILGNIAVVIYDCCQPIKQPNSVEVQVLNENVFNNEVRCLENQIKEIDSQTAKEEVLLVITTPIPPFLSDFIETLDPEDVQACRLCIDEEQSGLVLLGSIQDVSTLRGTGKAGELSIHTKYPKDLAIPDKSSLEIICYNSSTYTKTRYSFGAISSLSLK